MATFCSICNRKLGIFIPGYIPGTELHLCSNCLNQFKPLDESSFASDCMNLLVAKQDVDEYVRQYQDNFTPKLSAALKKSYQMFFHRFCSRNQVPTSSLDKISDTFLRLDPMPEYFKSKDASFVATIKQNGFNPTWGFQCEAHYDYDTPNDMATLDGSMAYLDLPEFSGVAFDDVSQRMCFYHTRYHSGHFFDVPAAPDVQSFDFIPYGDIYECIIEKDTVTQTTAQTTTNGAFTMGAIGGLIAGSTGAIVAANAAPTSTTVHQHESLRSVTLIIKTTNKEHPRLQFTFPAYGSGLTDFCSSFFSSTPQQYTVEKVGIKRNGGSIIDFRCKRQFIPNTEDPDFISKLINPESALLDYQAKIDAIIVKNKNATESSTTAPSNSLQLLRDLKFMLDEDLITQAEYDAKKAEILLRM